MCNNCRSAHTRNMDAGIFLYGLLVLVVIGFTWAVVHTYNKEQATNEQKSTTKAP